MKDDAIKDAVLKDKSFKPVFALYSSSFPVPEHYESYFDYEQVCKAKLIILIKAIRIDSCRYLSIMYYLQSYTFIYITIYVENDTISPSISTFHYFLSQNIFL